MKISLKWLREIIPFELSDKELAERLTMVGLEVEEIIHIGPQYTGVVVGDVLKVEKHPNADKLHVCQVDVGNETVSVVCGAPNVAEGQRVAMARVGARLAGDFEIKPVTLRGVRSEGMICSERELGISDSHDGILVLDPAQFEKGADFNHNSDAHDAVLAVNVTPNRPDCLSHIGIAREVGVITGNRIKLPDDTVPESGTPASDWIAIEIEDPEACPRYSARVIRDVKIGPSPDWLKNRIESLGVRSINNVVDVTNLVMFETGQPLHAFDYNLIADRKIVVRLARKGESFNTLDGRTHTLTEQDLLICDGKQGVALAGIMGGENSEVSETTRHILLESANFDPPTIRKTAKRLGMSTEASQRLERGCDPNNTLYAANRAARLLSELAGGSVAKNAVDCYPSEKASWTVALRPERIARVLGMEIPPKKVNAILSGLGLKVDGSSPMSVTVPTFRPDLKKEIDLIEEVVRHYGYDNIPAAQTTTLTLTDRTNRYAEFVEGLRDFFVGRGFSEIFSNSMVSSRSVRPCAETRKPVPVQNPLSPDTAFLRSSLISCLLDAVVWNRNRSQSNLRLFEIGRIFELSDAPLPRESEAISGILTGETRPIPFWGDPVHAFDYSDLKGAVEALLVKLHLDGVRFLSTPSPVFTDETSVRLIRDDVEIGFLGEIRDSTLADWDVKNPAFAFEMDISALEKSVPVEKKYRPISRFPGIKRDLAIVIDESVPSQEVVDLIRQSDATLLTSVDPFDVYRGEAIPAGKKSMAFSLTFLSADRTLQEEDIDPVMEGIIQNLHKKIQASLRT
jgi:phenylalanyl-tRNA synthetase beta chain